MKKSREYCCCAIPMVNAGLYAILVEQFVISFVVGILAVATPSIVGAASPSFAPLITAILCFIVAGIQVLGLIGVSREKPTLYKRFVTFHAIALAVLFSVAATWAIISATRHETAKTKCIADFFTSADGSSASEGDTLCTIFPWVDVGIMGALWVILAIVHGYFYFVLSAYGRAQRRDHDQYDRVYDPSQPLTTDNIPLDSRNDPWDARGSDEFVDDPRYAHGRKESAASASDILSEPYQEPKDGLSGKDYSYSAYPDAAQDYKPTYPTYAHTEDPAQTPTYHNYGDSYSQHPVEKPARTQHHPAEGSFGRKTPRYGD